MVLRTKSAERKHPESVLRPRFRNTDRVTALYSTRFRTEPNRFCFSEVIAHGSSSRLGEILRNSAKEESRGNYLRSLPSLQQTGTIQNGEVTAN
jgi:hypothetical protein